MTALLPAHPVSAIIVLSCLLAEFFLGWWLTRLKIKHVAWLFPVVAVLLVHIITLQEPAAFRMVALILVLLTGMKVVMAQAYPKLRFTFVTWWLYCFAWVGMNPELFFKQRATADRGLLIRGALFLIVGSLIMLIVRLTHTTPLPPESTLFFFTQSLIILVGFSMVLHFGLLNINAWVLQRLGYASYSLFREPLKAESLRDFWGKRWNLAFTEMTSVLVFRPCSKRLSQAQALGISFLFSGALHEVALSFSVNRGYGLPTLYFIIQFLLIVMEEKIWKQKPGKFWVISSLIIPLPLLFNAYNLPVFWQLVLR